MIPLMIIYGSYLIFPFFLFLFYILGVQKNISPLQYLSVFLLMLLSLLFIYSRFIERNIIVVHTTQINVGFQAKIVVISDMHLGAYKNEHFLTRVVNKVNALQNIEALLIPGDFSYYPPEILDELFAPLAKIQVPVYAVLGNHDSEHPGPPIHKQLQNTLEKYGVHFLHNTSITLPHTDIKILGLGDHWAGEDDLSKLSEFTKEDQLIVLTHNPDTTIGYSTPLPTLTISGHTHGGQIRIPFLYTSIIPSQYGFDQGLYLLHPTNNRLIAQKNKSLTHKYSGQVFVSSGVGEVGLPMRLGIPPVIDILELY